VPGRSLDLRGARLAAADLLARRAWPRAALEARLRRRGAPPEVAAEVVADLVGRGYVDDAAFARHWVESRAARGLGPVRLRTELRARGVAGSVVEAALEAVRPDVHLEAARDAARRRLPVLRATSPERAAARLRDHLLRRGFGAETVARVVRETLGGDATMTLP